RLPFFPYTTLFRSWRSEVGAGRRCRSDDRAAETASGHRRLDRAIHRHARAALARRVPAFGFGPQQSPGRDIVETHPGDRRKLASVAGLRADALLEWPGAGAIIMKIPGVLAGE